LGRGEWRDAPAAPPPAEPAPVAAPPAAPPAAPIAGAPPAAEALRSPPPLEGSDRALASPRRTWVAKLASRAGAGLAAGALVLAALELPSTAPPVAPVSAAAAVAVASALLPRIAWFTTAAVLATWLALGAGLDGAALVALLAVLPTPLLLPRAGTAWSMPAAAPLLGTIALAPAFVAVAGLASTTLRRAALGAAGFLWLAAAEALSGEKLLYGAPAAVPAAGTWTASLPTALTEAVAPFVFIPALAPALLWALFAALAPLAVRGRSPGADLARGAVWAAALATALLALGEVVVGSGGGSDPRGGVLGPIVAVVLLLAVKSVRGVPFEAVDTHGERPPATRMSRADVA
jgi:hypothetical protein